MKTSIGPYELVRLIESGGQGQVYLGYDSRLHRQVAIKIHRLPDGRLARKTAMREARLVASLRDERVVRIYDVIESSGYLVLVMEYVPGVDLEHLLANTRLRVSSVLRVSSDVAAALAAARQIGVVHGDIKASNVLVTADGRARLVDFGIASGLPGANDIVTGGSLSAVAPEQLLGETVDVRADLFALGRLLYRMLTGEHAFPSTSHAARQALLAEHYPLSALDAPEVAAEVPPALVSLVRQLLQRDPAKRLQDTHQVRRILRALRLEQSSAGSSDLLQQAKPSFRPESATDVPLEIPGQLQERRLGARRGAALRAIWSKWMPASTAGRIGLLGAAVLFCAGFAWWIQPEVVAIEIDLTDVDPQSAAWAAPQVDVSAIGLLLSRELESHIPGVRLGGAARPSVVYGGAAELSESRDIVAVRLRCADAICLLALERQGSSGQGRAQRLLFADAAPERWALEIRHLVAAVYPD
ncbi:serine/threonine protein kinase [Halioglobus maricola]|uniref:Serine/threonine protein kinase n=1 Tax=Halioglobus maricola TaxID=2601894 RepID=A0A5P9NJ61_9GAMM|nr:serine/threonine-protein kinase [Halioglobus maricola]QFU75008.1 serine/threonine protein kinase [Halioglobus maricola]